MVHVVTYDTTYLAADFFQFIKDTQAWTGHERHALKLARALEIRVRVGLLNRSNPEGLHGPQIMVQPWYYGNSDMLRHEVAHVMLWWSGLEAEIIHEFGHEAGWKVIENLCHQAIAFLRIPQPLVDDAVKKFGVTARAVQHLARQTGARPEVAMRRLVYDDPRALRAGFILNGTYVQEVAQCNWSLPFGWLDHVPKVRKSFPQDANVSYLKLPGTQSVGVCWG